MKQAFYLAALFVVVFSSCKEDNPIDQPPTPAMQVPEHYTFKRNGNSSISHGGQTERLRMVIELNSALSKTQSTENALLEMFRNKLASGGDADPFADAALNASGKSIREKVAASAEYFSAQTAESAAIKDQFEQWIESQVNEINTASGDLASAGKAGQIADGSSTRYVSAGGFEYNQFVVKGLIGALTLDQILNHYLSPTVLDGGSNKPDNEAGILVDGKNYTNMEHYWDEAYGYLFGNASDTSNPMADLGSADPLLNKYLKQVDDDSDFKGIAERVYYHFRAGRQAIVEKRYDLRDASAAQLKKDLSKVIAVRSVHYLELGAKHLEDLKIGSCFHALSEAYGFIFSLRFTHNPQTGSPYFTKTEIDTFLNTLSGSGTNGFWDLDTEILRGMSMQIADRFGFSPALTTN